MNDFDFEELDKAVNRLAPKTPEEHSELDPVAQPKSAPSPRLVEPKESEPAPSPSAVATSAAQPAEPKPGAVPVKHRLSEARPRGRGAFMDIVPASITPRKGPTRVGVSIQPVSKREEIVPEELKPEDVKPTPTPEPEPTPQPLSAPDSSERARPKPREPQGPAVTQAKSDEVAWPDPLDFNTEAPAKEQKPAQPKEVSGEPEPLSPFLAEAKVEKRPLGAFSNFKPTAQPEPPEPQKPAEPAVLDELTPEADGTFKEPEKAPLPPKERDKPAEKAPAKPDLHGAAMMAIPDQYRAEPKVTDKTPRPVYDTKEYHPPLLEAAVHEHRGGSSVWGKLFIALVVLALLAVAGYFVYIYFFVQ